MMAGSQGSFVAAHYVADEIESIVGLLIHEVEATAAVAAVAATAAAATWHPASDYAAADRTVTAELLGLHQLDTGPECRAAVADALVRLTEPSSYDAKLIAEVRTCPDGIIVREKRFKLAALAPAAPR